ncbi:nuclear transport factor 2 family protein [Mucilaginibacter sp. HMF5004]|uniref:nuclear transport factor 2 family protein n=1 Tax=Mucilaginibacter rivuli TaxID=2857527 RepID=UPI001C5CC76E|nr:nuclear transport factor 2 family protein [Mucilaginibacter rivuli]MBW4888158.1 nuclear transport factor 2 family protein [Mucilaginibacter rivuli]
MKTLKATILGLLIVMTFGAAKANSIYNNNDDKMSVNYAVNVYVDAISRGHVKELAPLLDDNLKYSIEQGSKTVVFSKSEFLESLKADQNVEQNCLVTTTVNESTPDVAIVKVDMKYAGFTRTNFVTLTNSSKGWKVTNIYSKFK